MVTEITYFYKIIASYKQFFSQSKTTFGEKTLLAVFYIFVYLFHVWFNEDDWILISVSAFNLLEYVVLVEIKKITPHADMY